MSHWICVDINLQELGYTELEEKISNECKRIFKSDFLDLVIVGEHTGEYFAQTLCVFIKLKEYQKYVDLIKQSLVIFNVIPSTDKPQFIPEHEILKYKKNVDKEFFGVLRFCDIVLVKKGYLKNLKGIVLKALGDDYYLVYFRLFTRKFTEKLHRTFLGYEGSLFSKIKIPVIMPNIEMKKFKRIPVMDNMIASEVVLEYVKAMGYFENRSHQVHRKGSRKLKRNKKRKNRSSRI